uniref:Uncharacterized protein n=1 Tax=Gopherus evgoodei TaxID=1825980 RepID=A0A8C4W7K8_9SAUR
MAGFGNLMQDVLWCFSQVKGTIDIGVTEGRFIFPFCTFFWHRKARYQMMRTPSLYLQRAFMGGDSSF